MTTDYSPIPCALYDRYELAIMQRRRLRMRWEDEGVAHCEVVTPVDLCTRAGEEYLIALGSGGDRYTLRLDRIRSAETL
jgi:transcriptional antiterminator Rof (Rho-off)